MSKANLFLVSILLIGCSEYVQTSAPVRIFVVSHAILTENSVESCARRVKQFRDARVSVDPHHSGGFAVSAIGRDMMLSSNQTGLWERVGFFVLSIGEGEDASVFFSDIRGSSTLSRQETQPPSGNRWEPFDDQEQALATTRLQFEFAGIARCLSDGETIA